MAGLKITVDATELDRLAIGGRLYDALQWRGVKITFTEILTTDRETGDTLIKESDLLKLIQLVNPCQSVRPIRLIKG